MRFSWFNHQTFLATLSMKFVLFTVVCLFGVVLSAPGGLKYKRDILPGDPRFGTEYHLHHHHKHEHSGEVQVPHQSYGPPNYTPGTPIGPPLPNYTPSPPIHPPAVPTYATASSSNNFQGPNNNYLAPAIAAAQTQTPVNNGYLAPEATAVQHPIVQYTTVAPVYKPVQPSNGYLEPVIEQAQQQQQQQQVYRPVDSYGTPVPEVQQPTHTETVEVPSPFANYGLPLADHHQHQASHHDKAVVHSHNHGQQQQQQQSVKSVQHVQSEYRRPVQAVHQHQPTVQKSIVQAAPQTYSVPVHHHQQAQQSQIAPVHHHQQAQQSQIAPVHHHQQAQQSQIAPVHHHQQAQQSQMAPVHHHQQAQQSQMAPVHHHHQQTVQKAIVQQARPTQSVPVYHQQQQTVQKSVVQQPYNMLVYQSEPQTYTSDFYSNDFGNVDNVETSFYPTFHIDTSGVPQTYTSDSSNLGFGSQADVSGSSFQYDFLNDHPVAEVQQSWVRNQAPVVRTQQPQVQAGFSQSNEQSESVRVENSETRSSQTLVGSNGGYVY